MAVSWRAILWAIIFAFLRETDALISITLLLVLLCAWEGCRLVGTVINFFFSMKWVWVGEEEGPSSWRNGWRTKRVERARGEGKVRERESEKRVMDVDGQLRGKKVRGRMPTNDGVHVKRLPYINFVCINAWSLSLPFPCPLSWSWISICAV